MMGALAVPINEPHSALSIRCTNTVTENCKIAIDYSIDAYHSSITLRQRWDFNSNAQPFWPKRRKEAGAQANHRHRRRHRCPSLPTRVSCSICFLFCPRVKCKRAVVFPIHSPSGSEDAIETTDRRPR